MLAQKKLPVYKVMVFFETDYFIALGDTPEDALANLQNEMNNSLVSWHKHSRLTYRPADMMVFYNGNYIPCGTIIQM
jgi:hypothetical protein